LGAPVNLTAIVSSGVATGNVVFFDGVNLLGTAPLAGGQASLTTRLLPSGSRALSALYSGDTAFGASKGSLVQPVRSLLQNGFAPDASYTVAPNTPATSVADFNSDGLPDLVVAGYDASGNGSLNILINNGDGTFQNALSYPAGNAPAAIAAADLDGDGVPDVVTAAPTSGTLNIFLSNSSGIPGGGTSVPAVLNPQSVVIADFNGDGIPDLASGNGDGSVTIA